MLLAAWAWVGWGHGVGFEFERGDRAVGDAAGDDEVEVAEVGGDVEGEAVRCDGLRDVDADGGDFLFGMEPPAMVHTPVRLQMRWAGTPKSLQVRMRASSMRRTKSTGPRCGPRLPGRSPRRSKMG